MLTLLHYVRLQSYCVWMWRVGIWLRGDYGSDSLTVVDDFENHFQP